MRYDYIYVVKRQRVNPAFRKARFFSIFNVFAPPIIVQKIFRFFYLPFFNSADKTTF